jgi:hypothetical protein
LGAALIGFKNRSGKLAPMSACLNFTLYSGRRFFPWSQSDVSRLSKICREFAGPHYSIDIIHIEEERRRAFRDGVLATPAVLLEMPCGRRQNLGGFDETEEFLRERERKARKEVWTGEAQDSPPISSL